MRNVPYTIMSAATAASITSPAYWTGQMAAGSLQPLFTDATTAGTMKVQGSNDAPVGAINPQSFVPTNWSDIPSATSTVTAGVGPMIVLSTMNYQYIRAVFTRTGGTTGTVVVNATVLSITG